MKSNAKLGIYIKIFFIVQTDRIQSYFYLIIIFIFKEFLKVSKIPILHKLIIIMKFLIDCIIYLYSI